MSFKDRLKELCLIMVADTKADLAGIIETIRSRSEGSSTYGCKEFHESLNFARPSKSRIDRTEGGEGNPIKAAKATRAIRPRVR
jgi:hypothetical protein